MSIAFDGTATSGLATKVAAAAGGLVLLVALVAAGAGAGIASLLGGGGIAPSATATATIPRALLALYQEAATTCPGLSWTVLAGIGEVESGQGRDDGPSSAGAVGVVQMLPSTFAEYALPVPPGGAIPPSPLDPTDEIYAAARMLCANGAKDGANISGAIYTYNHTATYVHEVLSDAASYAAPPGTTAAATAPALDAPSKQAAVAIAYALGQIGTPYVWGGETPGVGFDCSGLTQAAYAAAGIHIPRTSTAQWTTLPHVPLRDLEPGDLVFFEPGEFTPGLPGHVGIYLGHDEMVDAPHTGTDVQIDKLATWPTPMGAARPSELLIGSNQSS